MKNWKRILTGEVNENNKKYIVLYFAVISFLEILAYLKGSIFSVVASRVWLLTAITLGSVFGGYVIYKLYDDLKQKRYIVLIGFLWLLCFLFYYIGHVGFADINPDATQQLGAGLDSFHAVDWNYTGQAFLGYANRKYVLGAIPALLFGRSVFTLHLGFAGLFIVGLCMMYFECREWLKLNEVEETLALLPCYAMIAFRFIAEYYLNFEQAITPVALTMMGIALFMKVYRQMDVVTLIAITRVGCFYSTSYTPALASLGLLICFMILYAVDIYKKNVTIKVVKKTWAECKSSFAKMELLGASVITMGCFFVATLLGEREDRLTSVRDDMDWILLALDAGRDFFTDKNAVFFGVFLWIVLLYMIFALTFRLKFYDFVMAVWVLGVVVVANVLVGYTTSYEKCWILQRNMIVIPVLVTGIFLTIVRILRVNQLQIRNRCIIVFLLFFGLLGVSHFGKEHQSFTYFRYIQPMKFMITCAETVVEEKGIADEDDFNIILITDNLLQSNIYDYATFFYPNASAYSMTTKGNIPPNVDWSKRTIVFSESEEALLRLGVDIQSKEYSWYYGEIK